MLIPKQLPREILPDGFHHRLLQNMDQILTSHNIDYYVDYNFLGPISNKCANFGSKKLDKSQLLIVLTVDEIDKNTLKYLEPYSNQTILFFSAVYNFESDLEKLPTNTSILHFCHDMMFQMNEYPKLLPQKEKNPNMEKFWISLSHVSRMHRILSASYLLGLNLGLDFGLGPPTGLLRISPSEILEYQSWQDYYKLPHNLNTTQQEILHKGFVTLKDGRNGGQPVGDPYFGHARACDNVLNFQNSLRSLYHNSLIEIVNETTFFNKGIFLTEKFLNSVYGYNLPIVLSNQGVVEYLRQHGFDMFDDVIDHSYDTISDPLLRITTAIDSNIELLSDKTVAWQAWKKCKNRLDNNYYYARDKMYDFFAAEFNLGLTNKLKTLKLI